MAENVYEGMYILDSNLYSRDPEAVSGQISKMIEAVGGEIMVSRMWEERRLAYQIDGHRKGTYWLTYFRAQGKEIANLERQCQLSDTIIRVLFLKVDPRIVDALVAHAQAGPAKVSDDSDLPDDDDDIDIDIDEIHEEIAEETT
ncbi:MAG: 30S ribosomal protein S6 [Pirellulales bacterium]|nr:30S ribosomal protein S6 [Pirellulales bacterium]